MQNVTVHLEPEHENCALVRFFFYNCRYIFNVFNSSRCFLWAPLHSVELYITTCTLQMMSSKIDRSYPNKVLQYLKNPLVAYLFIWLFANCFYQMITH